MTEDLSAAAPIYETHPAWEEDIREAREFGALPETARAYVRRVSELAQRPITMLSVGPRRDQTIAVPRT